MLGVADEIAKAYLSRVRVKEDFISAACPFHKGGQERRPSFWISRSQGNWGCFTCQEKGSNLILLLRQLGIRDTKAEASIEEAVKEAKKTVKLHKAKSAKKARASFRGVHTLPEGLLGVYDWTPTKMLELGFEESLLTEHDIGFDNGHTRITFPLRDFEGSLVGISGGAVLGDQAPKYKFYDGIRRDEDGKEIRKGELGEWYPDYSNEDVRNHLWRIDKVYPQEMERSDGQLILVEGFKAALWLVQHGWTQVLALMGSKMTQAQERMIRRFGAPTYVLMDNDGPGRSASKFISTKLAASTFPVYECQYPEDHSDQAQPDDLNPKEIEQVLTHSKRAGGRYVLGTRNAKRHRKGSKVYRRRKVR